MALIVPTITAVDPAAYKTAIDIFNTFTNHVHIDISSGELSPDKTIPVANISWPAGWTVSIHMMVAQPSIHLPALIKLNPSLVIFQVEVQEDLLPTLAALKQANIRAGVAMTKPTFPGNIRALIEAADHALIFSGDLGKQGGTADLLQLEKVDLIRGIKKEIEIGWDGGADLKNVRAIAHSGIDVIYAGSAITNSPDPAAALTNLQAESEKQGVF